MIYKLFCVLISLTYMASSAVAKKWEAYECELLAEKYFDGDSFWVKTDRKSTYIFRLYGVDCAETDKRFLERLVTQAKQFNIPQNDVVLWGEKAKKFTKKFLEKKFTVYTRKEKARGAGEKIRYYALIVNADGERLDEALVKAGLARVYGFHASWNEPFWGDAKVKMPRDCDRFDFERRLKRLEKKAQNEKVGVWQR